ncbi:Hypothetical_protein [Hexamita inflata]|uniref:Hypothetical_protein n=1 Tax=Hexamita inflata TaxID=28002 RepID=A0ABP1HM20_9EUKA
MLENVISDSLYQRAIQVEYVQDYVAPTPVSAKVKQNQTVASFQQMEAEFEQIYNELILAVQPRFSHFQLFTQAGQHEYYDYLLQQHSNLPQLIEHLQLFIIGTGSFTPFLNHLNQKLLPFIEFFHTSFVSENKLQQFVESVNESTNSRALICVELQNVHKLNQLNQLLSKMSSKNNKFVVTVQFTAQNNFMLNQLMKQESNVHVLQLDTYFHQLRAEYKNLSQFQQQQLNIKDTMLMQLNHSRANAKNTHVLKTMLKMQYTSNKAVKLDILLKELRTDTQFCMLRTDDILKILKQFQKAETKEGPLHMIKITPAEALFLGSQDDLEGIIQEID